MVAASRDQLAHCIVNSSMLFVMQWRLLHSLFGFLTFRCAGLVSGNVRYFLLYQFDCWYARQLRCCVDWAAKNTVHGELFREAMEHCKRSVRNVELVE